MIYGFLKDTNLYTTPALKEALRFIEKTPSLADGRHELADGAFANIKHCEPAPEPERDYESHYEYIDVQAVIEGEEQILVRPKGDMQTKIAYNAERDVIFYHTPKDDQKITIPFTMRPGSFLLLFPEDIHKAECRITVPKIRKLIVKIPKKLFGL